MLGILRVGCGLEDLLHTLVAVAGVLADRHLIQVAFVQLLLNRIYLLGHFLSVLGQVLILPELVLHALPKGHPTRRMRAIARTIDVDQFLSIRINLALQVAYTLH